MKTVIRFVMLPAVLALLGGCAADGIPGGPAEAAREPGEIGRIHLSVIRGLSEQGRSRAALAFLDDYALRYPDDPEARALRGEALLRTGEIGAARAIFQALDAEDHRPAADYGLGQVNAADGDWDGAVRRFRAAVAKAPTNVRYLNNLGYALLKTGAAGEAYDVLARARELAPRSHRTRNNFVLAALRSGHGAAAERAMRNLAPDERARVVAFAKGWKP